MSDFARLRRCLAVLIPFVFLAAACGGGQTGGTEKTMTVALPTKVLGFLPFYVAQKQGFFADRNLQISVVKAKGKNAVTATVAGDADAVITLPELVIAAQARGAPLTMVGATVDENMFSLYVAENVESLAGLRGKKVGIMGKSSGIEFMTRWLLDKKGIGGEKVQIVQSGVPPAAVAALASGQIAGRVFTPYFGILAQRAGATKVADFSEFEASEHYPQVVAANEQALRDKPDAVRAFMAGIVEASNFIAENPDKALDIAVEAIGGKPDVMAEAFERVNGAYALDGSVSKEGLRWVLGNMKRYGTFESLPAVDEMYDSSFLPADPSK